MVKIVKMNLLKTMTKEKKKSGRPTKHQVRYRNSGRPTAMTEQTLQKLKEGFAQGFSIENACIWADIAESTYYDYASKNPNFSELCKTLQKKPLIKSILVINKALNEGDIGTAKWYAERKGKDEFSTKTETQLSGEITEKVVYIDKEEKEEYNKHIDEIINED